MGFGGNEIRPPEIEELTERFRRQRSRKAGKDRDGGTEKAAAAASAATQKVAYPGYLSSTLISVMVFVLGATMRADWLLALVHYRKSQGLNLDGTPAAAEASAAEVVASGNGTDLPLAWNDRVREFLDVRMANYYPDYVVPAFVVSYLFFFGIGGFLHYYYYYKQRGNPETWKCQPNHWLPANLELHEIVVGGFSLSISSFISSVLSCYIMNGGWCTIYYGVADWGYLWFVLQWPAIFIFEDYLTYWTHRIYHWPFLYKHFHKLHHTYKQPTAFSVTAIHPFEILNIQAIYAAPMFLFPVHWVPYTVILMYTYYHGIIEHSGINFKRAWWQPWQPDVIFHDNHHQYYHVNFGFNIELWDKIHGTYRKKDRVYTEDIYGGCGKALDDATADEIRRDLDERVNENPLAYQDNTLEFAFTDDEKDSLMRKIE